MGRKPCCEKTGLKKGKWTEEEDAKLINYIKANGNGSWRTLPKNAGLLRCGKSCRLRWINYLREDLKRGNFTQEEEETIVKLHKTLGNRKLDFRDDFHRLVWWRSSRKSNSRDLRWSMIASHLPGRTDNEIKNYWNSKLSRRVYSFRSICKHPLTNDMIKIVNRSTKQLGRTSRAIAKKYNNTSTNSHSTPSKDMDPLESTSLDGSFSSSISDSLCPEVEAKEYENIFMHFKNILGINGVEYEGENIMINDGKDEIIMNSESDTSIEKRDCGDCCINTVNESIYAYSSPIISYFNNEEFHWDFDGDGEELINLWTQEEEDINSLPSQSNETNK